MFQYTSLAFRRAQILAFSKEDYVPESPVRSRVFIVLAQKYSLSRNLGVTRRDPILAPFFSLSFYNMCSPSRHDSKLITCEGNLDNTLNSWPNHDTILTEAVKKKKEQNSSR